MRDAALHGVMQHTRTALIGPVLRSARRRDAEARREMERRETVVIVDDDREIRTLMELALSKPGRTLVGFGDGQAALDFLASADAVDLVVSDVLMEGFDGHRLLRHLRANARTAATPVIFVTAAEAALERIGGLGERSVEQ